jgi:SCF-associated factor 1
MPTISDIPIEVFLDNLLPTIPLPDLLRFAQANKYFHLLINDDTFWKQKLDRDYNFSGKDTARVSGWKTIYRGLHNPRIFVWGSVF